MLLVYEALSVSLVQSNLLSLVHTIVSRSLLDQGRAR